MPSARRLLGSAVLVAVATVILSAPVSASAAATTATPGPAVVIPCANCI